MGRWPEQSLLVDINNQPTNVNIRRKQDGHCTPRAFPSMHYHSRSRFVCVLILVCAGHIRVPYPLCAQRLFLVITPHVRTSEIT